MESQESAERVKLIYNNYLQRMKELGKGRDDVFELFRRALEKEKIAQIKSKLQ